MRPSDPLPEYKWPKPHWKAYLVAFITFALLGGFTILGALPAILDDAGSQWLRKNGVTLVLIYLPLAALALALPWLVSVLRIAYKRITSYPNLYTQTQARIAEFDRQAGITEAQMQAARKEISALVLQVVGASTFEISGQRFDAGKLYISLRKRRGRGYKLSVGDILRVRHTEDDMFMGTFEVTQVRNTDYIALGISNVDALWAGRVRERGEITLVPNMEAIYIPKGEANG